MIHEDNGLIIVDELRPMRDAPPDEWVIYFDKNYKSFQAKLVGCCVANALDEYVDIKFLIGWLPMPIYRPEVIL